MKAEIWSLLKVFVIAPVLAALAWHTMFYLATGRLPEFTWNYTGETECGSGPLRWDCWPPESDNQAVTNQLRLVLGGFFVVEGRCLGNTT